MKGFSILEVLVAISILVVGVSGAVALMSQTISVGNSVTQRLIAAHLAQEGLEVIQNIRHTNWIEGADDGITKWSDGLDGAGCTPEPFDNSACPIYAVVNYNSNALTLTSGPIEQAEWDMTRSGGRYTHNLAGEIYSRHIEISYAIDDNNTPGCATDDKPYMRVKSIMRVDDNTITLEDNLYNWKDLLVGIC
jgi:prepilin-type N-terminal cleavage/methylation domain-containing protein